MLQKVQSYIQKHRLLTQNRPILVGVSGGTDSVVLLHILISLGYDCIIAHCNFHLRIEESDLDEIYVRKLASNYNIKLHTIDFKTIEYANKHGISIEMAARNLRYKWFEQLLEKYGAQAIAVAHHADDSIETLLLNLVRGTGLRGLTGISPRNNNVVRPLLCCNRLEIENYLIEHELTHVEDSTNALSDYKRNKIRNEVIPLLSELNPAIKQTLYTNINHFDGALAIYQQAISDITNRIVEKSGKVIKMDIQQIKEQAHTLTVLYELLQPYNFNSKVVEQICEHLDSESGKIFYSETHRLIKDRGHLIITDKNEVLEKKYSIYDTDTVNFVPFELTIRKINTDNGFQISKLKNRIHVDASKISFPLTVRPWTEGDIFYPFGMNTRKKLSDFFIDNKLSLLEKEQVRVLISGENEIVWIIGLRTDNRFRVNENTKDVLEINIQ